MTSKVKMLGSRNLAAFRCPRCHALLFKASGGKGTIEVKCRKCGYMVSMHLKEGEVA